jgi:quercetin dioxygenase-like cupin family protein
MDIKRSGSQPSVKGPAEYFTGTVRIDPLFEAHDPARTSGASVTFEQACSDTQAHSPVGQAPIVTAGCGLAQRSGGSIEQIRPGDVIWFGAGPEALARCQPDHGYDAHRHCWNSLTARPWTGWNRSATNNTMHQK